VLWVAAFWALLVVAVVIDIAWHRGYNAGLDWASKKLDELIEVYRAVQPCALMGGSAEAAHLICLGKAQMIRPTRPSRSFRPTLTLAQSSGGESINGK
jgi:hypothetical protein